MKDINNLYNDWIAAKKSMNKDLAETLGFLYSAIENKRIELRRDLNTDEKISVVKKQAKQINETLRFALDGGRNEIADKCKNDITILSQYLPSEMSYEDVKKKVMELVSPGMNMGQAMKIAMPALRSVADSKNISKAVYEVINGEG